MSTKREIARLREGLEKLTDNKTWEHLDRLSDVRRYAALLLYGLEPEEALIQASNGVELTPLSRKKR